jgi:uncharacterized protein YyaL (SSP411 family)
VSRRRSAEQIADIFGNTDQPHRVRCRTAVFGVGSLRSRFDPRWRVWRHPMTPHSLTLLHFETYWRRVGAQHGRDHASGNAAGGVYDHIGWISSLLDRPRVVGTAFRRCSMMSGVGHCLHRVLSGDGNNEYAKAAQEILTYVLRDMTSQKGILVSGRRGRRRRRRTVLCLGDGGHQADSLVRRC